MVYRKIIDMIRLDCVPASIPPTLNNQPFTRNMNIHILTLFPEMFVGPLSESIIKRAIDKKVVNIFYYNLRDYAIDKHKTVDDTPCGGGSGMVLKVDIMDRAISSIVENNRDDFHIILLTPKGTIFDQEKAYILSKKKNLLLISGHYEGFDQRIRENLIDEEISLGRFVMTGGEIPTMAIIDSVIRLLPGALGNNNSPQEESFSLEKNGQKLLEYPIYTKPNEYKGWKVPEILLSGDHEKIRKWREEKSVEETNKR